MRHVQIEIDRAGAVHCIAGNARRTIVDDAVVVVVGAGGDVDWLASVKRKRYTSSEESRRLAGREQVELVPAIVVGASPIGGGIVAILREEGDAASVVIRAAERVLNLTREIAVHFPAKRQFQRIALQVSQRLHLADLPQQRIPTICVPGQRSVGINGAKRADSTVADVDGAERALRGYLALHAEAVLELVGNMGARIEYDDAGGNIGKIARLHGEMRGRVHDKAQQVHSIEVQKIADRTWAGAVVKHSSTSANDRLAFRCGRPGKAQTRSKVIRIIVEIVLKVVTDARINREVRAHSDVVFEKSAEHLFQKSDVALAGLQQVGCGNAGGIILRTREGVSSGAIGEIVEPAATDIGNVNTETDLMFTVGVGSEVGSVEVVFGPSGVGLGAPGCEQS